MHDLEPLLLPTPAEAAAVSAIAATTTLASTQTVRRALSLAHQTAVDDLLFLEAWERRPTLGGILRVRQLRRANPGLAAELRAEIERAAEVAVLPR